MSAPASTLRRIGRAADVPWLEGRSATVDGERVAVFNTERGFVAIGGACPHSGGPLADGLVSESCVTCPLHNWRIDLHSGMVVAGGEGRVPVYELVERHGELYLSAAREAA
ncbi:MAG: Rieske 2Fe-2S domain-containing protein [Thermoleophilaceae bacterium]